MIDFGSDDSRFSKNQERSNFWAAKDLARGRYMVEKPDRSFQLKGRDDFFRLPQVDLNCKEMDLS